MGINGLLPLLKSIHKPCSLKKFDGKTLGVDAYGWLHRGTVACAMELALGRPTRKFVDFAMHRVRMLQHYGVTPYLIFDGDYLPSKAATEQDRSKRREESKKAAVELLNAGKTSQAYLEFQKAVDVTPEMARQLIDELRKAGVQYVVAPYEADAQMVYLERKGLIHGIISEDSDLLVFGAKCLLTKLDQYGNCIEINKADFCAVREISLTGWSDAEFRRMAILSGCDYLSSMSNMGLKTAYRMVRKYKTIEKIIRMLQFDGKFFVPKGYLEAYQRAELTFLHQRVFCPRTRRLVFHTEPEEPIDDSNMPFLGQYVDPKVAQGVACGDLNPITKLPIKLRQADMISSMSPFSNSSRPRPQRTASLAAPCKDKSIDTFFKAKRVPLAELDINCFTPSPTQQDALRRNSGPWSASPAPRPYLNRASTDLGSQTRVVPTNRTNPVAEPRPAKRARLCEDAEVETTAGTKLETRSRFFSGNDSSPLPRNSRSKKSRKSDITIFSDDSIEEAMLSLSEDTNQPQINAQAAILDKDFKVKSERDSQHSITPAINEESTSQISLPSLTGSFSSITSSLDVELPCTPTDVSSKLPSMHNLSERFSAKPGSTPRPTTLRHGLPTPISTAPRPSRIPLAVKPNPAPGKQTLTPLQRLGFKAANQPRAFMSPPLTPTNNPRIQHQSQRLRSSLSKDTVPFPEVLDSTENRENMATLQVTPCIVEPAMLPLPEIDEEERIALAEDRQTEASKTVGIIDGGSEDLIVHDSEEEEPLSPIDGVAAQQRLNLGRFVFAG